MLLVVAYDVETTNPAGAKRLRSVAKLCQKYGVRVQNSVFEIETSAAQLVELKGGLQSIIDQEQDANVRERRIKQLDKGRTWTYIKQHVLKDQRNSGYIRIYYDHVPDKAAATINEANELLTTDCGDCHREALRLLLTVRNDERAQNALGVAYWLCGQHDEALECFRRAVANGNADARENLRQLEKGAQQ